MAYSVPILMIERIQQVKYKLYYIAKLGNPMSHGWSRLEVSWRSWLYSAYREITKKTQKDTMHVQQYDHHWQREKST